MGRLFDLIAQAKGVACDSRHVKPGYIFVAIKGRTEDGNHYARDAEARGAIAVVTDQQPPTVNIPIMVIPNARKTLAELAAMHYKHPSQSLAVTGVTGTNGKTTVTYMLEHILRQAGFTSGLIGTVKVNTGRQSFASKLTTPDAISIQSYLAQMKTNGVTHAIMEVSAQGVEMHRVDNLHFSCGVITNISPDHLDFHGSFENYLAAKKQFINLLDASTPLIVNIGDPYCRTIADAFSGRLITAAIDADADITARVRNLNAYGSQFDLCTSKKMEPTAVTIHLPIPGYHNIENALLASAAALANGVSIETIAVALASFRCVERRMNIFHINGRTVIDDTALNPGSINAILGSLSAFRCPHIIVVNAIRGNRGYAINQANAAILAAWQQKLGFSLAVTASIGNVETSDTVNREEKIAFLTTLDHLKANYTYFADLKSAIGAAYMNSHPSDLLALLGAQGMDDGRKILTALAHTPDYPAESMNSKIDSATPLINIL